MGWYIGAASRVRIILEGKYNCQYFLRGTLQVRRDDVRLTLHVPPTLDAFS